MDNAKVAIVTGASSGLGLETAALLRKSGFLVYGGARSFPEGISSHKLGFQCIKLDVCSSDSCKKAVETIAAAGSFPEVLINNAGRGLSGTIEDTPVEDAKSLFDLNLFGAMRMTQAVLPGMRERRRGVIINIGSLMARVPLPYQGLYGASKAALSAFSDSLSSELRPLGIRVALIEPGDFASAFTGSRKRIATPSKDYAEQMEVFLKGVEDCELGGKPAGEVAKLIVKAATDKSARRFLHVSGTLSERMAALLNPFVPKSFFERLLASHYMKGGNVR